VTVQEEPTELLLKRIERLQFRMLAEIGGEAFPLFGAQVLLAPTRQREQPAIPAAFRIGRAPSGEEVEIDQPDDMKAIRNDLR
jgi:hypothetical protein